MAEGDALGVRRALELKQGTIEYWESGAGRTIVFVHGLFVNSALWRTVVPAVSRAGFRCITPDWPFGAHRVALADHAALDPPAIADLICDFLAALELYDAVLVANDTGGAYVQMAIAAQAGRVGGLVLTPCDSFEYFFAPKFRYLHLVSRFPGTPYCMAQILRFSRLHRLPQVFGRLSKRAIPSEIMMDYLLPMRRNSAVRRDLGKILRGVDRRYTLAAAREFHKFTRPVLLVWATEDRVFPLALAERMAQLFPDVRMKTIEDSFTFVPEDQPLRLAELIIEFAGNGPGKV